MSKIKIHAIGGLNENGKNCYVVEVDDDIFVFDCGIKFANENLYGIDYIIPDFSYLVKNKKRIKGLFLTHGHQENMGATQDLINEIPNLKVYATKYTKYVLETSNVPTKNIIEITPNKKIDFGNSSVFSINVNHSVPNSVMFVLNTPDGSIVYTGDFIIDPTMSDDYSMDLGKVAYVGKQKVLALLSESQHSEKVGHSSPKHRLVSVFKDALNHHPDRVMYLVLPNHLYTMQEIFDSAANTHRKVIIMGKMLQNAVSFAKQNNYLKFNDSILGDLSNIDDKDAIIIIPDTKDNPYASINKIINGYDKFIKLKPTDTVVFAVPKYDSSEKILVKTENALATQGCKIVSIPKEKLILHHASSEDLMLMLGLIKPKYYIPVQGEYRYMVNNANLAKKLDINPDNIILKQNGEIVEFEKGKLLSTNNKIKVNDVLIDGKSSSDVGDLVIKDREMLSENGIVLISATISKKEKVLLVGPEITTRGFIYVKDSSEMINNIKEIAQTVIERNISPNYIDYNKIKTEIRDELGKYLYRETECKPMIIAVVQEV